MRPAAAKCTACWEEPHCRSTVTPVTLSGQPAPSTAFRAMSKVCSPTWLTQPHTTSSTTAGSIPDRLGQGLQHVGRQRHRVHPRQPAIPLPDRRPDRLHDHRIAHAALLLAGPAGGGTGLRRPSPVAPMLGPWVRPCLLPRRYPSSFWEKKAAQPGGARGARAGADATGAGARAGRGARRGGFPHAWPGGRPGVGVGAWTRPCPALHSPPWARTCSCCRSGCGTGNS